MTIILMLEVFMRFGVVAWMMIIYIYHVHHSLHLMTIVSLVVERVISWFGNSTAHSATHR